MCLERTVVKCLEKIRDCKNAAHKKELKKHPERVAEISGFDIKALDKFKKRDAG